MAEARGPKHTGSFTRAIPMNLLLMAGTWHLVLVRTDTRERERRMKRQTLHKSVGLIIGSGSYRAINHVGSKAMVELPCRS